MADEVKDTTDVDEMFDHFEQNPVADDGNVEVEEAPAIVDETSDMEETDVDELMDLVEEAEEIVDDLPDPADAEPVVDEEVVEEVVADEVDSSSEADQLRQVIADLIAQQEQAKTAQPAPQTTTEEVQQLGGAGLADQQQPTRIDSTPVEFVTEEEFNEAIMDSSKFNTLLNKVYTRGVEAAVQITPSALTNHIRRQVAYESAITAFYNEYPMLKPFEVVVQKQLDNVYSQNANMAFADMLMEAGKRSVELLKLATGAEAIDVAARPVTKTTQQQKKPRFAGASKGTGSTRTAKGDTRTPEQKELDELANL